MKKNTLITLGVFAIAVIIAAAIILIAVTQQSNQSDYELKISEAEKYMRSGDYDKAIIAYKSAISLDKNKEEGYLGLYRAYVRTGRMNLAAEILQEGYNNTNSEEIRNKLQETFPELLLPQKNGQKVEGNYDNQNESNSSEGPNEDQTETTSPDQMKYELSGHVYDAESGVGIEGILLRIYSQNDVYNKTLTTTDINGAYYFALRESGEYIMQLSGAGYESDTVIVYITEETQRMTKDFTLTYVGGEIVNTCMLTGSVLDATTGSGVSGVELTVYPKDDHAEKQTVTTDGEGTYSVTVNAGSTYLVDVRKDGYISESFEISIAETESLKEQNLTISPEMQSGEIRIVLTWGASPSDLDSHLMGTASDGTSVWCYYSNSSVRNSNGMEIANLDIDDTTAYGPETTTIYDVNGVYKFSVKDYGTTGTMALSGATVKIYYGDSLLHTITVPSDVVNVWNVCRIDHGSIQIVNTAG